MLDKYSGTFHYPRGGSDVNPNIGVDLASMGEKAQFSAPANY